MESRVFASGGSPDAAGETPALPFTVALPSEQVQHEIVNGLGVLQGFVEFFARGIGSSAPPRIAKRAETYGVRISAGFSNASNLLSNVAA